MATTITRVENQTQNRTETPHLHPLVLAVLASDLARALKASAAGTIFVGATLWLFGYGWDTILRGVIALLSLSFFMVWLGENLHLAAKPLKHAVLLAYAVSEAHAELWMQRDLNRSGRVGDVVLLDEPHEPNEIIQVDQRPIITNKPIPPETRWRKGKGESEVYFTRSELAEFVLRANQVGLARRLWIGGKTENGEAPKFVFETGRTCERPIYDLLIETIEKQCPTAIVGRTDGHTGRITDASAILQAFGVE